MLPQVRTRGSYVSSLSAGHWPRRLALDGCRMGEVRAVPTCVIAPRFGPLMTSACIFIQYLVPA